MVSTDGASEAGTPGDAVEDDGPIGVFPSWPALYTTVVVYATALIVLFAILSAVLDYSG